MTNKKLLIVMVWTDSLLVHDMKETFNSFGAPGAVNCFHRFSRNSIVVEIEIYSCRSKMDMCVHCLSWDMAIVMRRDTLLWRTSSQFHVGGSRVNAALHGKYNSLLRWKSVWWSCTTTNTTPGPCWSTVKRLQRKSGWAAELLRLIWGAR